MPNEDKNQLIEKKKRLLSLLEEESWDELVKNNVINVYNDTDSAGISLYTLTDKYNSDYGIHFNDGNIVTDDGYSLIDDCGLFINDEFEKWFVDKTNSNDPVLNFKREKICDVGLWLKRAGKEVEAKKNYILHVLDNEGSKKPKFLYTGVKLARSVIPLYLRKVAKEIVEYMLMTEDRKGADKKIQDFYEHFCKLDISLRAMIQKCNGLEKYAATNKNKELWDPNCPLYIKGAQGHIKAALNFNHVIKTEKLKKYEPIKSGEICKIVILEKNKYGFERMAFVNEWPEEFNSIFTIDNKALFEKVIYDEIKRIYNSIGWPPFNPTQNLCFNFYDIFGEN